MSNHYILVTVVAVLTSLSHAHIAINSQDLEHMKTMARSMDSTADPCNDFYQYACGSKVLNDDSLSHSIANYFVEIRAVLQEYYPITRKENQHYTEKLQIYAQTGKNAKNGPVLPFLDEIKPGPTQEWPLLEEMLAYATQGENYDLRPWTTDDVNVLDTLGHLFRYGLNNVLISHRITPLNGTDYILLSVPHPTPIPANKVLMLLSSTKLPQSTIGKYLNDFIETHQYLQSIYKEYSTYSEHVSGTYTEVAAQSGSYDLLAKFVKGMLPHPVKIEEQSMNFHVNYFDYLLTKKWQPDEARKLCNYIMFQFLLYLQESVKSGYYINSTLEKLALGMNYVYYKHFYLPHKKDMEEGFDATVKTLYKTFVETVTENRLNLNAQQVQEITNKFNNITTNIGNLPENVTESMVEDYYSALPDLDPDNFYKNELLIRKHAHLETWICPADIICQNFLQHAIYVSELNWIVFPFTALLPPMFELSWHPVFSMSLLGFAAGHEIMHTVGPLILNNEKYTPSFGGDSLQVPSVYAAVTCLNQQYPTVNVEERLADVIGAHLAFRTYSRAYGLQPSFTRTTWQQLFFMSLSQTFCGFHKGSDTKHDRAKIRLQEIVMNSREFAEAFQCPTDSNMNPVEKCSYI